MTLRTNGEAGVQKSFISPRLLFAQVAGAVDPAARMAGVVAFSKP
jgi:hypothetical protein